MCKEHRISFLLIASLLILGQLSIPGEVKAAITMTVNTTAETNDATPGNGICADSTGKCSLRAAIQEANALAGADTILVPSGTYNLTKQLPITQDLTIDGSSRDNTILDGAGPAGAWGFNISPTIQVDIIDLTLQDFPRAIYISGTSENQGQVYITASNLRNNSNTDTSSSGSAVVNYCEGCTITLLQSNVYNNNAMSCGAISNVGTLIISDNSNIYSNTSTGSGGAICNDGGTLNINLSFVQDNAASGPNNNLGGGIYQSDGTTIISQSRIQGNSAEEQGGGMFIRAGSLGVQYSTIIDNTAISGGGLYIGTTDASIETTLIQENQATSGGGIYVWGNLEIVNCSIVNNTAAGNGGGLNVLSGDVTLINTTVSGNRANRNGGGIFADESFDLKLASVTISNNIADADNNSGTEGGGGIYMDSTISGSTTIKNTIIAGNENLLGSAFELYKPDCVGVLTSAGYNLIGKVSSMFCTITGNMAGTLIGSLSPGINPLLSPLTTGGYSTYYHPLEQMGPAIDRGNPTGCTDFDGVPLDNDQRGESRVFGIITQGYTPRCDLGAVESAIRRFDVFLPLTLNP